MSQAVESEDFASLSDHQTEFAPELRKYRDSNLIYFSFIEGVAEFVYSRFLAAIITFKNNGGFNTRSGFAPDANGGRPPLASVYLLITHQDNGKNNGDETAYQGLIRVVEETDRVNHDNTIITKTGQLCVKAKREASADCVYSVPIGEIKRGAQVANLSEENAQIKLYAEDGWIVVIEE